MALESQIVIALCLDFIFGDPKWFPHPVRLIGWLATTSEPFFRRLPIDQKIAGLFCAVFVIGSTALSVFLCIRLGSWIHPVLETIFSIMLIYLGIAAKDMITHAKAVFNAINMGSIDDARKQVSYICGRDTDTLDEKAIIKATLESIGENTVDGIIAPLFFVVLGGPVLLWTYKAVSTLDSTVGYKNERYYHFGWASAKLDDVMNFVPARITGLLMPLAASTIGLSLARSYSIFLRDRKKHPSPNSAHGEAALAGALGIQLGGTSFYEGKPSEKPVIGLDVNPIIPQHILLANALLIVTTSLSTVVFIGFRLIVGAT
jgi:adenosylcobinamide-phosphate synthase